MNTYVTLTDEQDKKISEMAEELGATKQECIRRLISEGNIYDLRINIDMTEEFMALTSEINNLNRMVNNIYTVCKRVDGILTKHEVEHLYDVMHEIRDSSNKILSSIYKTNSQLKVMALSANMGAELRKRMEKLIKEKTKKAGD